MSYLEQVHDCLFSFSRVFSLAARTQLECSKTPKNLKLDPTRNFQVFQNPDPENPDNPNKCNGDMQSWFLSQQKPQLECAKNPKNLELDPTRNFGFPDWENPIIPNK